MVAPHIDVRLVRGYSFQLPDDGLTEDIKEGIKNDIFAHMGVSAETGGVTIDKVEVEDTREAVGGNIESVEQGRVNIFIASAFLTPESENRIDEAASNAVNAKLGVTQGATYQDMRAEKVRSLGPDFA